MATSTPLTRYIINNDHEGDVYAVSKKAEAFALARRWADEDRIAYSVIDTMPHRGVVSLWQFPPAQSDGRPLIEVLADEDCDR
jgi:hypothetical protein